MGREETVCLPDMVKSAYEKLIDGIDLEESRVILLQVKTKTYLGEGRTGDCGLIWDWEMCKSAIKSVYLPRQLVGDCTRTFEVVVGTLLMTTRTSPPRDVALHKKIVGLPCQSQRSNMQLSLQSYRMP